MKTMGRRFFIISLSAAAIGWMAPAAFAEEDDTDWFLYEELKGYNTAAVTADEAFETTVEPIDDSDEPRVQIFGKSDSVDTDKVFQSAGIAAAEPEYHFEIGDRDSVYLDEIISESGIPGDLGSVAQVNVEDEAMSDMIRVDWENDECIITPTQNFSQVTLVVVLDHDTCQVDLGNAYCTAEDTGVAARTSAGAEKTVQASLSAHIGQKVNSIDPEVLEEGMNKIRNHGA